MKPKVTGWAHIDFFGGKSMYLPMSAACVECDRPIEIDRWPGTKGAKWVHVDTDAVECDPPDAGTQSGGG